METIIAALVGLAAGVLSGLIAALAGKRKVSADAAKAITDAATALVTPLTVRIETLERELIGLRPLPELVKRLRRGINKLIEQIRCLGHEPVWTPETDTLPTGSPRKSGRGA
jgi:hypothetical protein